MFFHDFPGIFQDFPGLFPPFPMANSPGRHRRGGGVGLEPSTRTHLQARGAQDQQAPRRAPLAQSRVDGVAMDM